MSILLVLVDFGVGLEMQEALDLHENLYKFCGDHGANNKEELLADNDTNWPSVLEKVWAKRLVDVFHNLRNWNKAPNFALCHLLFKFNKVGFIIFGESDCLIKTKHCDDQRVMLTQCDFCPVL